MTSQYTLLIILATEEAREREKGGEMVMTEPESGVREQGVSLVANTSLFPSYPFIFSLLLVEWKRGSSARWSSQSPLRLLWKEASSSPVTSFGLLSQIG